ncbi:MAG: hypothetical protein IIY10_02905 [Aeriscardovia sp.]|nr:hypothetical protein [Aeriscardovia sp.]
MDLKRIKQKRTVLHPVPESDLQALNSSVTVASQICAPPASSALPPSSGVANSFKLQLSTSLTSEVSSMEFFIAPSKGVTLDRQMAKGEMEIGGIPLSDFPNLPEVISAP